MINLLLLQTLQLEKLMNASSIRILINAIRRHSLLVNTVVTTIIRGQPAHQQRCHYPSLEHSLSSSSEQSETIVNNIEALVSTREVGLPHRKSKLPNPSCPTVYLTL
uniref:Uncharacterized protein n=1 Tax=Glossina pallidipes TaxID=7398 RepID=A0A1A9ZVL8_GLOPL